MVRKNIRTNMKERKLNRRQNKKNDGLDTGMAPVPAITAFRVKTR